MKLGIKSSKMIKLWHGEVHECHDHGPCETYMCVYTVYARRNSGAHAMSVFICSEYAGVTFVTKGRQQDSLVHIYSHISNIRAFTAA